MLKNRDIGLVIILTSKIGNNRRGIHIIDIKHFLDIYSDLCSIYKRICASKIIQKYIILHNSMKLKLSDKETQKCKADCIPTMKRKYLYIPT